MKVNGSISPDVFILEDDPSNPMLQRAIFRENVTKQDMENTIMMSMFCLLENQMQY